jgi:hypothetical protein
VTNGSAVLYVEHPGWDMASSSIGQTVPFTTETNTITVARLCPTACNAAGAWRAREIQREGETERDREIAREMQRER